MIARVYKRALDKVRVMVGHDGITSSDELNAAGRALFGRHYAGALPPDQIPQPVPHQTLILNTHGGRGRHWLLRQCGEPGEGCVWYDSFNRPIQSLIKTKYAHTGTRDELHVDDQHVLEANCGQRVLAAGVVAHLLGLGALRCL